MAHKTFYIICAIQVYTRLHVRNKNAEHTDSRNYLLIMVAPLKFKRRILELYVF